MVTETEYGIRFQRMSPLDSAWETFTESRPTREEALHARTVLERRTDLVTVLRNIEVVQREVRPWEPLAGPVDFLAVHPYGGSGYRVHAIKDDYEYRMSLKIGFMLMHRSTSLCGRAEGRKGWLIVGTPAKPSDALTVLSEHHYGCEACAQKVREARGSL